MPRRKGDISRNVTVTTARYRIWKAMRILRRFTIPHLIATASAPTQPVTRANAQKYVFGLEKGGYLRIVRPRMPVKMGSTIYMLANDTGPNPPRLGKAGIFDPNLEKSR